MAKTVVFVVLSARTERTKDTLKGIPLRIPRKVRKSSQQPHRFLQKHAVVNVLLMKHHSGDVCLKFEVLSYKLSLRSYQQNDVCEKFEVVNFC